MLINLNKDPLSSSDTVQGTRDKPYCSVLDIDTYSISRPSVPVNKKPLLDLPRIKQPLKCTLFVADAISRAWSVSGNSDDFPTVLSTKFGNNTNLSVLDLGESEGQASGPRNGRLI